MKSTLEQDKFLQWQSDLFAIALAARLFLKYVRLKYNISENEPFRCSYMQRLDEVLKKANL